MLSMSGPVRYVGTNPAAVEASVRMNPSVISPARARANRSSRNNAEAGALAAFRLPRADQLLDVFLVLVWPDAFAAPEGQKSLDQLMDLAGTFDGIQRQ